MARTTILGSQMPAKGIRTFTKTPTGKSRKERMVWLRISLIRKIKPEITEYFFDSISAPHTFLNIKNF